MSIVLKKLGIFGVSTASVGGAAYTVSEFAADHKPLVDIEDKSDSVKLEKPKKESEGVRDNRDGEAVKGFDVREEVAQKPVEISHPPVNAEVKETRTEPTLVTSVEKTPEAPTLSVVQAKEVSPAKPAAEQLPPKTPKVTEPESRPAVAKVPESTRIPEAPKAAVSLPTQKSPRKRVDHPWRARYHDEEFFNRSRNGYQGKWGEKYSRYLVGTGVRRNSETVKDNIPWWNEKFLDLQEDTKITSGKFHALKKITNNGGEALMKLCDAAYKADVKYITETGNDANHYKESEVWKYCSPYGVKVHTLVDKPSISITLNASHLHQGENRKLLVTVDPGKNNWFWELKVEEIKKDNYFNSDTAFAKMKRDGTLTADKIRETCRAAYSANIKADKTSFPKAEVYRYCSLTGVAYEGY